jgi:hypothetical protein
MTTDITDYAEACPTHRVYSEDEHTLIDKFKDKYMQACSSTERRTIAQLEMFPALFNYWKDIGKIYNKDETRRKSNVRLLIPMFQIFLSLSLTRIFYNGFGIHGDRKNILL